MNTPVANEQTALPVDAELLASAVRAIVAEAGYTAGSVSLAVVDDPTIHRLNRQHLDHDYPTDVLSFPLADDPPQLEGEIIISADTAIANAAEYGWPAEHELLLYAIHGALHLAGLRDKSAADAAAMRAAERRWLQHYGVEEPAGQPLAEAAENESPPFPAVEGANPS